MGSENGSIPLARFAISPSEKPKKGQTMPDFVRRGRLHIRSVQKAE